MSIVSILFFAVSIAFAVTVALTPALPKWFNRKPFNCVMCCGGWAAFVLAIISGYGYQSVLFLPAGMFAGAMVEAAMMRYL